MMKLIKINEDHYELDGIKVTDRLSEVKELIGEVDIEKRAEQEYREYPNNPIEYLDWQYSRDTNCYRKRKAFIKGYNQAIEDNKDKKYTEEDMRKAINTVRKNWNDEVVNEDEIIQSLQPKTEWEVEFINGKLKLA